MDIRSVSFIATCVFAGTTASDPPEIFGNDGYRPGADI